LGSWAKGFRTAAVELWEPTNGVVRLIVGPVAGVPAETSEPFQDLLLAELSDRPRFALVERGELNRILAEAELSLSQLGEPANAVRAGRLLNADWLLLMKRVSSGRSLLLARIVDTRSGVIRDITAFDRDSADLAGLVTDVAGFLVNSSSRSGATPLRQFLAFGGFQDLSVNPRHPELPSQLKAQLALAGQQHGYILVERELVDLLLQEVRLNLGGLVADTGPLPVMQGAFWLVDGYYQAFVERDRIMLSYGYRDLEDWEHALELVEPFGYRAVSMSMGGPWGAFPLPDLPIRSALFYREKLGRSTIDPKIMFASGQVVRASSLSDFVTDGHQCWVSFSNRLARLDQHSGEKIEIELPGRGEAIPKCLAQGADTVWIGTREAGVIAVDSKTLATRQWTESEGLLINHIQSVLLEADSLWIGYGEGYQGAGGFGRLDPITGKIRNWIPTLPVNVGRSESAGHEATSIPDPPDGPPRNRVVGIARGGPHTLWVAVARKGLQKFDTRTEAWTTIESSDTENRLVCLAANAEVMVAGCEGRLGAADTGSGNGGLTIVRAGEDQPRYLHVPDGLPHPTVTAVALHDKVAWIGGTGFVGILDLATLEFHRICPARTVRVTRINVTDEGAWVATDGGIERFTRDDIAGAGGTAKRAVQ
jgi:hypothetical protein